MYARILPIIILHHIDNHTNNTTLETKKHVEDTSNTMNSISEKIVWINANVKPFEVGIEPKDESSIYAELDQAFSSLPLNLSSFLDYFDEDAVGMCHKCIGGRTIDRLLVAVLNEEDNRIANFETKQQVILLFEKMIRSCRAGKLRMRRGFFAVKKWNDDIEPVRGIVTDWVGNTLIRRGIPNIPKIS